MQADMSGTLKLLIGPSPGAIAWSAVHLLPLLGVWSVRDFFAGFQPGTGPQGGEGIFLFIIMVALAATALAWIDILAVLLCRSLPGWRRFALWPLLLFGSPLIAGFIGVAMADAASDADLTDAGRARIAIGVVLMLAVYYGCCFGALVDVRRAREAARTTP